MGTKVKVKIVNNPKKCVLLAAACCYTGMWIYTNVSSCQLHDHWIRVSQHFSETSHEMFANLFGNVINDVRVTGLSYCVGKLDPQCGETIVCADPQPVEIALASGAAYLSGKILNVFKLPSSALVSMKTKLFRPAKFTIEHAIEMFKKICEEVGIRNKTEVELLVQQLKNDYEKGEFKVDETLEYFQVEQMLPSVSDIKTHQSLKNYCTYKIKNPRCNYKNMKLVLQEVFAYSKKSIAMGDPQNRGLTLYEAAYKMKRHLARREPLNE